MTTLRALSIDERIAVAGGIGEGWRLLVENEPLNPGDGFIHPQYTNWIDFNCRPDLFRGDRQFVHSGWPWRRRIEP